MCVRAWVPTRSHDIFTNRAVRLPRLSHRRLSRKAGIIGRRMCMHACMYACRHDCLSGCLSGCLSACLDSTHLCERVLDRRGANAGAVKGPCAAAVRAGAGRCLLPAATSGTRQAGQPGSAQTGCQQAGLSPRDAQARRARRRARKATRGPDCHQGGADTAYHRDPASRLHGAGRPRVRLPRTLVLDPRRFYVSA